MNGHEWGERFNSTVRGAVTLALVLTFCWMAIMEKVDPGIFANVLSSVVAFWFAAKQAEKMIQQSLTPLPPPGTTVASTETKTTETKTINPTGA